MFLLNNFSQGGAGKLVQGAMSCLSGSGQGGGGGGNVLQGVLGGLTGQGQGGGGGGGAGKMLQGVIGGLAGQGQGGGGGGGNVLQGVLGGGAGKLIQGAISGLAGSGQGGSGSGKLFAAPGGAGGGQAANILGGIVNVIGGLIANYNPAPPPTPCANTYQQEANENEEQRQFRRLFKQLAGEDMEVSPAELQNVLNKVVAKHSNLKTDGFSIDTCRSMVAVMDSDGTGKLGFEEFKYLWNNIKKWQCIYKEFDAEQTGYIRGSALPGALQAAGFELNEQLYQMLVRRYADDKGNINFDSFISSLVRMDAMYRAFKALDRDGDGEVQIRMPEWLKMTIYS
ncbi:calpain small subunit 1-like [Spea bombifrons]|uniref:calpain small subunit 1-like n=1 Tax=Spea bombifrons TaxID=233779 RepID=UPI00234B8FC0|nr:calpain small subunit 1-like [Spea bombifrons]